MAIRVIMTRCNFMARFEKGALQPGAVRAFARFSPVIRNGSRQGEKSEMMGDKGCFSGNVRMIWNDPQGVHGGSL